jgi:hypothetical protein
MSEETAGNRSASSFTAMDSFDYWLDSIGLALVVALVALAG